jgi:hypothetical protein
MANTTNFNWETPDDTDLVKDGAAAIRTLGNSIDTSFVDLKGGTTGQILSKASNTDLDYTWIANDQGDITEVQAGTGISVASGTGPIPVVTNTVATAYDAKGDLVVGTGADTFSRLAVGTNGYTLVADSSVSPTGLKWAAPAASGKVLQVVNAQITSATTISTDSLTDTGITATITPTAATSKILILITGVAKIARTQDGQGLVTRLLRGATTLQDSDQNIYVGLPGITSISNFFVPYVTSYYDSPNTTSATTYKLQGHPTFSTSSGTATFQPNSVNPSNITLLEIGA